MRQFTVTVLAAGVFSLCARPQQLNAADPAQVEVRARSVAGGFDNLAARFPAAMNVLNAARNRAMGQLTAYSGKISAEQAKLSVTQGKYQALTAQIARLERDLPAGRMEMKTDVSRGAKGVSSDSVTQGKVLAAIREWKQQGPGSMQTAENLLASHRQWLAAYNSQLALVGEGISAIQDKHNAAVSEAKSIVSGSDPWPAKLEKMTGRPQQAGGAGAGGGAAGAGGGGAGGGEPPLKQVVEVRGINWDMLQQEHKIDSVKAADAEIRAWAAWQKNPQGAIAKPDNFISNQMRSEEVQQAIEGSFPDFPNIDNFLKLTESLITTTRDQLVGYGVSPAYFGGSGTVSSSPPASGKTPPGVLGKMAPKVMKGATPPKK